MSSNKVQFVSYGEVRATKEPKILRTRQVSLGKLLRMYREREKNQLSRQALATMLGVSSRTIRNWENDISLPTSQHLRKLIEVYLELELFTTEKERNEAQELWLNRQEQDAQYTFPDFDELWFSRLLETGQVNHLGLSQNGATSAGSETYAASNQLTSNHDTTAAKNTGKPPTNLPRLFGPTLGREKELEKLQALLQNPATRLVTVAGPGGVGKTRLVLQTGHLLLDKFKDGVFFVCLAAIKEPALLLEMIAQTLEVIETSDLTLLQSLEAHLANKNILLIIDNFEQLKSAGQKLSKLLEVAPGLKLLVGSRVTLQILPEQVFELPPLAIPPLQPEKPLPTLNNFGAMEFLWQRAQQIKPDLALSSENALALAQICQRLDGLPLALELAAVRLKFFTPQALLRRLEGAYNSSPLKLLDKGNNTGPVRQQSLRQTLDWSYNLLDSDEQRLFCALAIFNDGCSLAACEVVCANLQAETGSVIEHAGILNLLTQLVEKSLLRYENDPDGEPRFMMLQTIREYALERLKASGNEEILWQKCIKYFVNLAETGRENFKGPEQGIWIARLEKEHNNLRAVLHWALGVPDAEVALRLVASLCWFWEVQGYFSEGLRWVEETLTKSESLLNDAVIAGWRTRVLAEAEMLA